jgi:hypothetical protein
MGRDARATWAKRVERWRTSGLSAGEFAAEIGVNARTLTYWKWKLGRSEPPAESSRRAEFVEVVAPGREAAVCEQIEVALESGVVIRVPARFDAEALRRIVAVLGGA